MICAYTGGQAAWTSNFSTPSAAEMRVIMDSRSSTMSRVSAEMVTPAQPLVGMVWLMVENICAGIGKNRQEVGQHAGVVLQQGVKRDDVAGLHVLEGLHGVLVLVKRAAADAHHPGRLAHGGRLAHLEHPPGLRHLDEYLRQGFCRYDVILLIAHGRKPPLMCPAETRPRRFFWPLSYHVV